MYQKVEHCLDTADKEASLYIQNLKALLIELYKYLGLDYLTKTFNAEQALDQHIHFSCTSILGNCFQFIPVKVQF